MGKGKDARSEKLRIESVSKHYGKKAAVYDLSLAIEGGMVAGLVGPNGCGKTTTLSMVVGLKGLSKGRITVAGHDVEREPIKAKGNLAFVPDTPTGFEHLTVREYLDLHKSLYQKTSTRHRGQTSLFLEAFGLLEDLDTAFTHLSNGTRRKVATIAAMSLDVSFLVIDEPTVGLDPESIVVLRHLVGYASKSGSAILLATQDLSFAEKVCDRLFLMNGGRLVETGSPAELRERYGASDVEEVFLMVTGLNRRINDFEQRLEFGSR